MAFPAAFIDELIARNPIEDVVGQYVSLKRSGANLFGLCPFHGEKTASFSVNPSKGIYYCFGCHKGGGVINFMMEIEGLTYPDSVRALAKRSGMEVPENDQYQSRYQQQERLWALHKEAARYFHKQLYSPAGQAALAYAQERGLTKGTLTRFGLGYAPDRWTGLMDTLLKKGYTMDELKASGLVSTSQNTGNNHDRFRDRLMFPIIDVRDNVIGFGGRIMKKDDNAAKYLNSPETIIFNKRKNLFAMNIAKKSKRGYLILVEGYMDAIALHQYGFDCAVASLGTALNEEGANLLSKYTDEIILIYDGDNAGQSATQRAIPILEKTGLTVKVLKMQDAKDPDEYLKKFGADRFKLLLEGSTNRIEYQLSSIARKYNLANDEERAEYVNECATFLATLNNAVQREIYGHRVTELGKISMEALKIEVDKALRKRFNKEKKQQEAINLAPARALQPRARNLRYDNVRSAMAEEIVIAMVIKEPALFDLTTALQPMHFSSSLLGKAYEQLRSRYQEGLTVHTGVLTDLTSEEVSHIVEACERHKEPVNTDALADCIRTICDEYQSTHTSSDDDLLAMQQRLRQRKGMK